MSVCFATNNLHKLEEVRAIVPDIRILSLKEIGFTGELREDFETLEENALQKAQQIANRFGIDCFADDSGLEVQALQGAPGAHTAHYAGPERDDGKNMDLLLKNLQGQLYRQAQFRTVIALLQGGATQIFQGTLSGSIADSKQGTNGFGYDPIFIPDGYSCTVAQLSMDEKNKISHRSKAVKQLAVFLNQGAS
ncbi:MAG: RdgB/HAM1 family non-canonical purine NTP pyrophosphatase [Bacteroidetes bacterium]|nr:RdgB/HAM1 family non-canonical purine NTP pyrophosphatase [Bacteroidota bacterium]